MQNFSQPLREYGYFLPTGIIGTPDQYNHPYLFAEVAEEHEVLGEVGTFYACRLSDAIHKAALDVLLPAFERGERPILLLGVRRLPTGEGHVPELLVKEFVAYDLWEPSTPVEATPLP